MNSAQEDASRFADYAKQLEAEKAVLEREVREQRAKIVELENRVSSPGASYRVVEAKSQTPKAFRLLIARWGKIFKNAMSSDGLVVRVEDIIDMEYYPNRPAVQARLDEWSRKATRALQQAFLAEITNCMVLYDERDKFCRRNSEIDGLFKKYAPNHMWAE